MQIRIIRNCMPALCGNKKARKSLFIFVKPSKQQSSVNIFIFYIFNVTICYINISSCICKKCQFNWFLVYFICCFSLFRHRTTPHLLIPLRKLFHQNIAKIRFYTYVWIFSPHIVQKRIHFHSFSFISCIIRRLQQKFRHQPHSSNSQQHHWKYRRQSKHQRSYCQWKDKSCQAQNSTK